MQKTVVVVLLVLATAVLCWIFGSGTEPAAKTISTDTTAKSAAPPVLQVAANVSDAVSTRVAGRTEAPAQQTTLFGRCVDEAGQPIAGVVAGLTGSGASRERMDAFCGGHPEPARVSSSSTTGADGTFRFEFWPPPPFRFTLRVEGDGRATWIQSWPELEPGATVDLGSLILPAGTLLRGRLVDTDGVPASGVVHFYDSMRSDRHLQGGEGVVTKDDGTFTGRSRLPAGDYRVLVLRREVERPRQVTLRGERELVVEVVVRKIDPAESLSGVVVDEQEQPVANAMLMAMPMTTASGWITDTDRQGRFRMVRPEHASTDPVSLHVTCAGYDPLSSQEKFAWGRNDIRLVMRRGLDLEVLVVTATGGAPVEEFHLYCLPAGGGDSRENSAWATRRNEGGRVTVSGLTRQRHHVVVVPKDEALAISALVPVDIADPGPVRVTVPVPRKGKRTVRVQRNDGSAVAGTAVQLTDRLGLPAEEKAMVLVLDGWNRTSAGKVLLLDQALTDAHGEVVLSGPAGRPLAVQLPGPGHEPLTIADVMVGVAEPLVITVSSGARLRGKVTPLAVMAELARLGGSSQKTVTIHLTRGEGTSREEFPAANAPQVQVGEDGTFALDGIPPGNWHVEVGYSRAIDNGDSGTGLSIAFSEREAAGNVSLQDGETAELIIDLSSLLPGELDGLVMHNGVPLAKTQVRVASDGTGWAIATTDAGGRFHATVRPGDYAVSLERQQGLRRLTLRAPERAGVARGQTTAQTFQIRSATVRLRLLDAQGHPVAGVGIELRDAADVVRHPIAATGEDGWTEGEIEVEPMIAFVLPKRLQSGDAQMDVWRNNPGNPDPFALLRIRLGSVLAVAGTTTSLELRLPPEWGR